MPFPFHYCKNWQKLTLSSQEEALGRVQSFVIRVASGNHDMYSKGLKNEGTLVGTYQKFVGFVATLILFGGRRA